MWPYMESMGSWMVLWWTVGVVVLVLLVRLVAGASGTAAAGIHCGTPHVRNV